MFPFSARRIFLSLPVVDKAHIERARFELRRGNVAAARVILSKVADLPQEKGTLFNLWATLETKEVKESSIIREAESVSLRPQNI